MQNQGDQYQKIFVGVWCPHFRKLKITWHSCRELPHKISVPGKAFYSKKLEVSELYGILERLEWKLITEYERLWRQKSAHYSSQEMTRAHDWKL